jgi:xanthine dehydrogenase accessory factor
MAAMTISDPILAAADLKARGVPFVMATVVRALAPTSARPGDKALFTRGRVLLGWVGGSCAEPIVREEAEAALRDGECRLVEITPDPAEVARPGIVVHDMRCYSGGTLEIYLEPYLPMPTLLVMGNSPVASALCELGRVMKYRVKVVDLGDRPAMDEQVEVVRTLDGLDATSLDPMSTFAVVSSHGVFDEEALAKVAELDLPYTGLVASRKRRDQVLAALGARGVSAEQLARISSPAGLQLGGRRPEEIALAVMAQIVTVRSAAHDEPNDAVPARTPTVEGHCHGRHTAHAT